MKYIVTFTASGHSDFCTFYDAEKAAEFLRNILQVNGIDNAVLRMEE